MGPVREDYSNTGNAWDYFTYQQARSQDHQDVYLLRLSKKLTPSNSPS